MTTEGKLLCIDHGIRRIGLAVSDPLRVSARELTILYRTSRQADFDRINAIVREEGVVGIVIGLPYNTAPTGAHSQADTVKLWVERFTQTTNLPILLWDERFSSEDAREISRRSRRKPTDPIDDLAARVILQSYLDALHDGFAPLPVK